MIDWFKDVFGWLPKEAFAALISMVPVIELRGGLPYAILSGVSPYVAFPLCIAANLLPIAFFSSFSAMGRNRRVVFIQLKMGVMNHRMKGMGSRLAAIHRGNAT